jgi:hypothetical protein
MILASLSNQSPLFDKVFWSDGLKPENYLLLSFNIKGELRA